MDKRGGDLPGKLLADLGGNLAYQFRNKVWPPSPSAAERHSLSTVDAIRSETLSHCARGGTTPAQVASIKENVRDMAGRYSCMAAGIALFLSEAVTTSARAANDESACLAAALDTYNNANLSLIGSAGVPMTANALIAQRRLEEEYCGRATECLAGALPVDQRAMLSDALFSSCLRDKAKKKYLE